MIPNHFSENFLPALGFANRTGVDKNEASLGYVWRFGSDSMFRSYSNFAEWQRFTNMDGDVGPRILNVTLEREEPDQRRF